MHINRIKIENLRNITDADIRPHKRLNIITGNNGAGKTTLLEAIYLLARAKSFRQKRSGRLVKEGREKLTLFAQIETSEKHTHNIGLQKSTNQTEIRKDGNSLKKLSTLAKTIPLTIITPNIQRIIEDEPQQRRRLLNWGLFHVEHSYGDLINRYNKVLAQRNRALRESQEQLKVWDRQLVTLGEEIFSFMNAYCNRWNEVIAGITSVIDSADPVQLKITPGWRQEETLSESLERNSKIDRDRGFTSCGPHRSDIKISQNGKLVKTSFSRGESKLTAIIMLLSQMRILADQTGEDPILLADDLKSELDIYRYSEIVRIILNMNFQSFITNLESVERLTNLSNGCHHVFHVEHGEISLVSPNLS